MAGAGGAAQMNRSVKSMPDMKPKTLAWNDHLAEFRVWREQYEAFSLASKFDKLLLRDNWQ